MTRLQRKRRASGGRQRCDLSSSEEKSVCVIIAAMNAAGTIQAAVRSALREPEVSEVVVVDDGSADETSAAAKSGDDGTGRLNVIRLEQNRGPSFARNQAIAASRAPLISILDADDFFLQGRFRNLLESDDWDFIADNIVFVDEGRAPPAEEEIQRFATQPFFLDLSGFIDGNISRRRAHRGEIGFLKPVMRRSFLAAHRLLYKEELRLGEDYDLYARALVKGARYKVIHHCGYGAVVRPNSLSGRHRTNDLKRLYEADRAILASPDLPPQAAATLRHHESHIRAKYELRRFLDIKNEAGLAAAGAHALTNLPALPAIVAGIALDKLAALSGNHTQLQLNPNGLRYLLRPKGDA
jgi:succinoglycan biosynthesis protein ExoU